MLDLKAKLAAAGLVTPAELAAAERKSGPNRGQHSGQAGPHADRHADRQAGQQLGQQLGQQPGQQLGQQPGQKANQNANQNRGQNANQNRGQNRDQARHQNPGAARSQEPRPQADRKPPAPHSGLDVPALQKAGKGAAYDAIRRLIERARIDPLHAIPGEQAEAFHFTTASGQLSRLMLEPEARTQLGDGSAGIVGFMSHHGLAHCVVPRIVAEDIARLFPFWLRVLKDHPGAGQQEPPRPPREPREPSTTTSPATPTAEADPSPEADPTPAA